MGDFTIMGDGNNPNIELYYNDIPNILDDLENTNFSAEKHGKILL